MCRADTPVRRRWFLGDGTHRLPHSFRALCGRVGRDESTLKGVILRQRSRSRSERLPTKDLCNPHTILCNNVHMATNLALDDKLIEQARRVGHHKTKKDAVTAALAEYVQRRNQLKILKAFGTVDFDPKYDYKAERRRRSS